MSCTHCSKNEVIAKGLCRACYYRLRNTGTLEYQRKGKAPKQCNVEGCDRPHVALGLCENHYRAQKAVGDVVRPFGYGERRKHPLYEPWRQMFRTPQGRIPAWDDFWQFVADAPARPEVKSRCARYDDKQPWGPENFYWHEVRHTGDATAESRKQAQRVWRKANPLGSKQHSLRKCFGMSLDAYLAMYEAQHGQCAICGVEKASFTSEAGQTATLHVDHCHASGKIRGLLCNDCNNVLGRAKDNTVVLLKAVGYLRFHHPDPDG